MTKTAWTLTLETERLILRPQESSDYESWYAGFAGRLPQQHEYDKGQISLDGCTPDWFANLCQRHQEQAISDYAYIFGVFLKQTDRHLGNVDISTIQREQQQWANLGYSIHNQYWRQGFAKEAVTAALRAGFEDFGYHRIEAAIDLNNHSSIALAQSVGLQQECVRRGFYYEGDRWVDHIIYVALPQDLGLAETPPIDLRSVVRSKS
jgi:[ribosomal protein S5]-alanine N-acetyltransferase